MKTEPVSEDYQDGWNTAHHDVTVDGTWFSINKIEESGRSQDYIEGYFASQDNLLEERVEARLNAEVSLNDQRQATASK